MKRKLAAVCLAGVAAMLSGCGGSGDFSDLEAFVAEVKARPKGRIEPLPEFKVYQAFTYSAANLRSPFQPPQDVKLAEVEAKPKSNIKPDFDRPKEPLEAFALSSLNMVGTIRKAGDPTLYALIADDQGGIHRVRVGNYIGKNFGRITALDETHIEIVEIVSDGQGGWFERPRSLSIRKN
ncbi:MAG: pilus assembly protein PilP [Gammaproteobacteria bacterium]|nr:MAG: pilus assembly protein PilP [Gammaproteobacteria bacterium]